MNYHGAICGKDFSDIYTTQQSTNFRKSGATRASSAFLRLMAMCVQAGKAPLELRLMASLKAKYESKAPSPWIFAGNVVGPINTLQNFGVDIFGEEFDTWVLQTVW
jgi:hypothetical protein